MSRAFGNRMLKQFVVAEPEIQDAVSLVRTEEEPEVAAQKFTEAAFTRGSADNITCIVVRFHHDLAYPVTPEQDNSASLKQDSSSTEERDYAVVACID